MSIFCITTVHATRAWELWCNSKCLECGVLHVHNHIARSSMGSNKVVFRLLTKYPSNTPLGRIRCFLRRVEFRCAQWLLVWGCITTVDQLTCDVQAKKIHLCVVTQIQFTSEATRRCLMALTGFRYFFRYFWRSDHRDVLWDVRSSSARGIQHTTRQFILYGPITDLIPTLKCNATQFTFFGTCLKCLKVLLSLAGNVWSTSA